MGMGIKKSIGKLFFLTLVLTLGLTLLAGCGAKDPSSSGGTQQQTQEPAVQQTQEQQGQEEPRQPAGQQEPAQPTTGQQEPAQEPQQVQAPEQKQEPTQENKEAQAPGNTASGIPKIPHQADAKTDCLACHQSGIAGAPKTSHPERKDQCFSCHPLAKQ